VAAREGVTMSQRQGRRVSKKEVKEILAQPGCKADLGIRAGEAVYQLSNGKMLVVFDDGKGTLWKRDDLVAVLALSDHKGRHLLVGLIPDAKEFISRIPELIDQLGKAIGIPQTQLDFSEESLTRIDGKVFKEIGRDCFRSPDKFPLLVAYVGEFVRRKTGPFSKWVVRLSSDGQTWEPWIIDPNGNAYNPFLHVFEDLHEDNGPQSLLATSLSLKPSK
jgi:hypothetical protein